MLHLAILTEFRLCQVVIRVNADSLEAIWTKLEDCSTIDMTLRTCKERLHVRHYRLKVLTLMQEHSIPVANLVLPVLLPLAES